MARLHSSNALSCENPNSFEMEDPKLRMPLKIFGAEKEPARKMYPHNHPGKHIEANKSVWFHGSQATS